MDMAYTDGVIAVKERYLLKDKLLRMCEASAEDAFRMLKETGFGSSAAGDYERLISADGEDIDAFVREYAPTDAVKRYLLAPRDFHNAKALLKAEFLKKDAEAMLAPEGLIPVGKIKEALEGGDASVLPKELAGAIDEAKGYLFGEAPAVKEGAVVGGVFVKAEFAYLKRACFRNATLKALISAQADMTNLLTLHRLGVRSLDDIGAAKSQLVCGGTLGEGELLSALSGGQSGYGEFVKLLLSPKGLSAAENYKDSYPLKYLSENKYELIADQPFLYYVLRRRAENADVRIIFACLLNGAGEREIKARLRLERSAL